MNSTHRPRLLAVTLACALLVATTGAHAEVVQTRVGELSFENGYPSKAAAAKLYDEMDFQRATQACLRSFAVGKRRTNTTRPHAGSAPQRRSKKS